MKISKLCTYPIALPVNRGVSPENYTSKGFRDMSHLVVVEIHTDEGLVGLGEATLAPRWSGETQAAAVSVLDALFTPLLLGQNPFQIEYIMRRIDRSIQGFPFTKSAIEIGLLDIMGKSLNVPVYVLLGGTVRSLDIPIRYPIVPTDPEEAAALARDVVSKGCSMLKLKVGHDPLEDDLERVDAVRDAVGPDVQITVDANGGWSVSEAVRACRALIKKGVILVEQPVDRHDIDGMADVHRRVDIPIMADECIFSLRQAMEVITKRAADIISIYPGKNGGIRNAVRIAEAAESHGISCAIGSNLEGQIGSCAMGHVAVAIPNINVELWNADLIGPLFHTECVVEEPLRSGHDFVRMTDRPGLGMRISEERLNASILRETNSRPEE